MTPQLQRYTRDNQGAYGDCYRTCIAMILDLPRDEVPHFNENVPPGTPVDHPLHKASWDAERAWLRERGLVPVCTAFSPNVTPAVIAEQFATHSPGVAAILLCSFGVGCGNHAVALYDGKIYDPLGNVSTDLYHTCVDGLWWVIVMAVATKPLQPSAEPATVATQETH